MHPAEHVYDLLQILDLRLQILLEELPDDEGDASPNAREVSGLFIAPAEVRRLLGRSSFREGSAANVAAARQTLEQKEREIEERLVASRELNSHSALEILAGIFGLSTEDCDVVLTCLAYVLDARYEKVFAFINNDLTKPYPTPLLVATIFGYDGQRRDRLRSCLRPDAPLLRRMLLRADRNGAYGEGSPFGQRLMLDERVADFLLGTARVDGRAAEYLTFANGSAADSPAPQQLQRELDFLADSLRESEKAAESVRLCSFFGAPGSGRSRAAAAVCEAVGLPALQLNIRRLVASGEDVREALRRSFRDALLLQAGLIIREPELLRSTFVEDRYLFEFLEAELAVTPGLFFICSAGRLEWNLPEHVVIREIEFGVPDFATRRMIWEQQLNGRTAKAAGAPEVFASRFRLTGGRIRRAIRTAEAFAPSGESDVSQLSGLDLAFESALFEECRSGNSLKLAELAVRLRPKFGWEDIVLPAEQRNELRDICTHVRFRDQVYDSWGFDETLAAGSGLNVLFSGPPGTGKSMAAGVIAKDLGLEIYRIDLSSMVSKYVGETEKNLSRIFDEAANSQAILFFDEADALFGKRSEVKDAHDRYANIETGYLLQKMEEFDGVTILASNLSENLDDAFLRRLHFVVDFPMPDAAEREHIWKLAFPENAPFLEEPDYADLSRRLKISGANIKNIALHAAFFAASEGRGILMRDVIQAARREYRKEGRPFSGAEAGNYLSQEAASR